MSERRTPVDPAVVAAITEATRKRETRKRRATATRRKVNLNLPVALVDAIKQESIAMTGHKRRGFSDLVTLLLEYGWDAHKAGDLELETKSVTVELRIVKAPK